MHFWLSKCVLCCFIVCRGVVATRSHSSLCSLSDHLPCLEPQLLESFALHVGTRRRQETGVFCTWNIKRLNVRMLNEKQR